MIKRQPKPNIAATVPKFGCHVKGNHISSKRTRPKLSPADRTRNFRKRKKKQFDSFWTLLDSNRTKARYKQIEQAANRLLKKDHGGKDQLLKWAVLGERFLKDISSVLCPLTKAFSH